MKRPPGCLSILVALWPLHFGWSGAAPAAVGTNAPRPPNIVLIMTDDQGYGDLGITGNPVLDTPHIDRLAREGATMSTFYVSPVCSPTRAAVMTGRYNHRTRIVDTANGRSMMEPAQPALLSSRSSLGAPTAVLRLPSTGKKHRQVAT